MKSHKFNYLFDVPERQKIRVIIDTDCKNEADDQFALVHALLTPKFIIPGVIGAHFGTQKCSDSMIRSYNEILKVMNLMDLDGFAPVKKGAENAIPDINTPVISEGSELIVSEALKDDPTPLFAIFWGPLTDMASAILSNPEIEDKIHVIWIGGAAWPVGGYEYNLGNDINAANVVMKSKVPVDIITMPAFRHIYVSFAEMNYRVAPYGKIGRYLFDQLIEFVGNIDPNGKTWFGESWCLGDSPTIGLLLNPHEYGYEVHPAPQYSKEMYYIHTENNRPIRIYSKMDSRFLLEDFYSKLALNYPMTSNFDKKDS